MSGNVYRPVYALTTLMPVQDGQLDDLHAELDGLSNGDASPFARVYGTHVARLTVVPCLDNRELEEDRALGSYLLFSTDFDGARDVHLERLRMALGEQADRIWGRCAGYPGSGRPAAFRDYFVTHQVDTGFSVVPYRATVGEIRESLKLRAQLVAFATRAKGLHAHELRNAWLATFGDRRGAA
jgi:hypothetical protein